MYVHLLRILQLILKLFYVEFLFIQLIQVAPNKITRQIVSTVFHWLEKNKQST